MTARAQYTAVPRAHLPTIVADLLGQQIVGGKLAAGQALPPQDRLSVELSVSRPVLREALKVLASKGLVEFRPKYGTRVRAREHWTLLDPAVLRWQAASRPDGTFLQDLVELRSIIEPAAAALAAKRASAEQLEGLDAAVKRMGGNLDDSAAYVAADLDFHALMLAASGNELLHQLSAPIQGALRVSDQVTSAVVGSRAAALPLHADVVAALRRRNPVAARDAMRLLIERSRADVDVSLGAMSTRRRAIHS